LAPRIGMDYTGAFTCARDSINSPWSGLRNERTSGGLDVRSMYGDVERGMPPTRRQYQGNFLTTVVHACSKRIGGI